jgi:hypothetical protein
MFGTRYKGLMSTTPAALSKLPDETLVAGVHRCHRAVTVWQVTDKCQRWFSGRLLDQ